MITKLTAHPISVHSKAIDSAFGCVMYPGASTTEYKDNGHGMTIAYHFQGRAPPKISSNDPVEIIHGAIISGIPNKNTA